MSAENISREKTVEHYAATQKQLLQEISPGIFPEKYLHDDDPVIRGMGVHAFNVFFVKSVKDYHQIDLIEPLLVDNDSYVRQKAFETILSLDMKFNPNNDRLFLIAQKGLADPDYEVRRITLSILAGAKPENPQTKEKYLNILEKALIHSDKETRIQAVELFYYYLGFYSDPTIKLKEILKDESSEVREAAASVLAVSLPSMQSPRKIFEDFSSYPIKEFPEVHGALASISLFFKQHLQKDSRYKEHLVNIALETESWVVAQKALWVACKRLSPYDPCLARIISAAIENDNEEIRGWGRYYYNLLIKWHEQAKLNDG